MRILIDVRPLQEGSGIRGIGTYLLNLLEHLSMLDATNEYILLHARGAPPIRFREGSGFRRHDLFVGSLRGRLSLFNGVRDWIFLRHELAAAGADVIHFTAPISPRLCYDVGRLNRRAVATVYDITPIICRRLIFEGPRVLWWPVYQLLFRRLRVLQHIIAISRCTAADLVRHVGLRSTAISTTLLALPADAVSATTDEAVPLPDSMTDFLLYIGELSPSKNPHLLCRALALLVRRHGRRIPLVIVGRRTLWTQRVQDDADNLGVAELVHFTGGVSGAVKSALLRSPRCRGMLFPSYYEGFGLPALEAMACGVPLLASRVGALPEVVGDAAVLLDPDNAEAWAEELERLLSDAAWAASRVEAGLRRAAMFDWRQTALATLDVYTAVAHGRQPPTDL